jgi:hypothetical protein
MKSSTKPSDPTSASQSTIWGPPLATDPSVSSTTIAAISRHTASSRPRSRRNRTRSAVAKVFPPLLDTEAGDGGLIRSGVPPG